MPSQRPETYTAHITRTVLGTQRLRQWILSIIPLEGLDVARRRITDLYTSLYLEIEDFQKAFSDQSNSQLREWAVEPYSRIPDYDPHGAVRELLEFPSKVAGFLKHLSLAIIAVGWIFSANWIYHLGLEGFSMLETMEGLIPLSFIGVGVLYLWFLRADTFIQQAVAKELRAGPANMKTRRRSQIVGHGFWNRSLLGQTGLFLAGVFYILDSLPEIPVIGRWFDDPAGYVVRLIIENSETFYHVDSLTDAVRHLFNQMR